jgi:hypothetical protein
MHKTPALPLAASLAALLALGACNNKPTTVTANEDDPQAEQLKNAKPVAAPPMIQASRVYRCKDNSLVYADFYTNNTVSVRSKKDSPSTASPRKNMSESCTRWAASRTSPSSASSR